jgi:uncharacterized protein (TIGR03118 family)
MNKFVSVKNWLKPINISMLLILFLALFTGCQKIKIDKNDLRDFQQVNLDANSAVYAPGLVVPSLQNAWGLAWAPSGIAWVNAQTGHVSELFTGEGAIVRPAINIPSPTDTIGGTPTGIVFAGGAGFMLANKQPAAFLFVGDDGVISGWNGADGNNAQRIANNSATASYFGLTLSTNAGSHMLYAANFKTGKIDVWDTTFTPVAMSFHDPDLPDHYFPFNIQAIGSWLFVNYAKVGADGNEIHQVGLGLVDVYNTDGSFVKRFASFGTLDSPWGVVMTPANFLDDKDMGVDDSGGKAGKNNQGQFDNDSLSFILIGNFGDGHINVFSLGGQFLGQLQSHNKTIVIDGLWALSFAPTTATTIDPKRLYFTEGANDETDGVFGYLIKN